MPTKHVECKFDELTISITVLIKTYLAIRFCSMIVYVSMM